jgi:hypothetical protein
MKPEPKKPEPKKPYGGSIHRAYREGRRAPPGAHNPYLGQSLQEHWSRGHRDRWLYGMDADAGGDKGVRHPSWLLAALLIAVGASAIIYSFIAALSTS